eukprot:COSAG01_NODE_2852_length_6950_cov_12.447518_10_plen_76_part_00
MNPSQIVRRDETYDLVHSHEALLPPMSGQTLRKITPLYEQSSLYMFYRIFYDSLLAAGRNVIEYSTTHCCSAISC